MSTEEWRSGFPDRLGGYRCLVDGQEMFLLHKWCPHNGKHRWMTTKGFDVYGCEVLWRPVAKEKREEDK